MTSEKRREVTVRETESLSCRTIKVLPKALPNVLIACPDSHSSASYILQSEPVAFPDPYSPVKDTDITDPYHLHFQQSAVVLPNQIKRLKDISTASTPATQFPLAIVIRPDWAATRGALKLKKPSRHGFALSHTTSSDVWVDDLPQDLQDNLTTSSSATLLAKHVIALQLDMSQDLQGAQESIQLKASLEDKINVTVGNDVMTEKEVYGLHDTEDDMEECVVCLTEPKVNAFLKLISTSMTLLQDTILLPCRHLSVCRHCFRQIDKCPVCRAPFEM